jgi:hypothetical protein
MENIYNASPRSQGRGSRGATGWLLTWALILTALSAL